MVPASEWEWILGTSRFQNGNTSEFPKLASKVRCSWGRCLLMEAATGQPEELLSIGDSVGNTFHVKMSQNSRSGILVQVFQLSGCRKNWEVHKAWLQVQSYRLWQSDFSKLMFWKRLCCSKPTNWWLWAAYFTWPLLIIDQTLSKTITSSLCLLNITKIHNF